jgi:hypothetical protein
LELRPELPLWAFSFLESDWDSHLEVVEVISAQSDSSEKIRDASLLCDHDCNQKCVFLVKRSPTCVSHF